MRRLKISIQNDKSRLKWRKRTKECNLILYCNDNDQNLSLLEEALRKVDSADATIISSIINKFSQYPSLKANSAYNRYFGCVSLFVHFSKTNAFNLFGWRMRWVEERSGKIKKIFCGRI